MSEADIAPTMSNEPQPSVGQILRAAREAQGISLGEVSGAMRFSTRQIEALENGDFEQLQGKAFLRGFVRAYARLLGLDAEPLLQMLGDDFSPAPAQIAVPENMGETNPVPFYVRHGKKLGLAAMLLLLGGGLALYLDNEIILEHRAQPVETTIPIEHSAQPSSAAAEPGGPAPAPDSAAPAPSSIDAPAAADASPMAGVTAPTTVPPMAALTFELSGRSWLEVKDASGQVLLTGEFPAGQQKIVSGKPPYQIWIGRASAVKLTYGDRAIDVQSYAREEVARLTVE